MRQSAWLAAMLLLVCLMAFIGVPAAQEQAQPPRTVEPSLQPKASEAPVSLNQKQPTKKLNPFTGNEEAIKEGYKLYLQTGCPGCHGPGGGGGMAGAPPMFDDRWKYGGDDETLFNLIKGRIPKQKMPPVFGAVLKDEQVWKIIAWIRSIYKGDPALIVW